ncbi:MAG: efflux RND transporter permease subunit, partial [Planctomycetes bacterium]|nr:efflux RND transporter permease subunit [Planctomycetota bacterium]
MTRHLNDEGISDSLSTRIVRAFLGSNFSILLILLCVAMGAVALLATPREEDPQVVVPFVDIFVETPGVSALETKNLAAEPLERLLVEIPGVEHVYSTSWPDRAMVTVRFEVGEDREKALLNVYNKLRSNADRVPPQVRNWIIKPVEIDDVPILALTLYSDEGGDDTLVRYADELAARLQQVPDLGRITVHGGQRRQIRVQLDPVRLRARNLSPIAVMQALGSSNTNARTGTLEDPSGVQVVEVGPFLESAQDLEALIITVADGQPVFLRDVATILDGAHEPNTYTRVLFGPSAAAVDIGDAIDPSAIDGEFRSAVTLSIAKRKGTNAVVVAQQALAQFEKLHEELRPEGVSYLTTRNYGITADEKVNELVGHLLIAVGTIVVLVGASLGWRSAFVVALAVPLTLAITLFADLLVGYTINRVTLFALILSLGLIVDDPIVDVENIHRHLSMGKLPPKKATLRAVDEVRPPVILATLAVMISFLPMFFVSGMMGPYMAPMPFNVPVAMFFSLVVAFTVTPWATYHLLKRHVKPGTHTDENQIEGRLLNGYAKIASFFVQSRARTYAMLGAVALAFFGSVGMAAFGMVPLKMLPFDNKSEFQILVNGPDDMPLETTDRAIQALAREVAKTEEVTDVTTYSGHASPHDFNGMVRHYFLRKGGQLGDLRVNLLPRHERGEQAHAILLRIRPALEAVAAEYGVRIALVEPPPGPPVLASVVAEVYGPLDATPEELVHVVHNVEGRFQ